MASETEIEHLRSAAAIARVAIGEVEPNPPVGAVVLSPGGEVMGRGFHRFYGGPHAEVEALSAAGVAARGGTLVVTLEPCSTIGKTPPCCDAVVEAGVRRVVCGAIDPNPAHAGAGLERLRRAGLDVEVCESAECAALLPRFVAHLGRPRPWVIAKWAMTLDGRIATARGDSRWVSGEAARARVHTLRGRVDAVAVGAGTVVADDPLLTARPAGPRRALRVVFDDRLDSMPTWQALGDGAAAGPPVILHAATAEASRREALAAAGAELIEVAGATRAERVAAALSRLKVERGVSRLLVEGGAGLLGALADIGAIDQVEAFVAPKVVGGAGAPAAVAGAGVGAIADALRLEWFQTERVGADVLLSAFVDRGSATAGAGRGQP